MGRHSATRFGFAVACQPIPPTFCPARLAVRSFVHPSECPSARPSVRSSVHSSVCPFVRWSILPSISCPSVRSSVRPSVHRTSSVHPSVRPSVGSSIRPFVNPSHTTRPIVRPTVRPHSSLVRPTVPSSVHSSIHPSVLSSVRLYHVYLRPSNRRFVLPSIHPLSPSFRPFHHPSNRPSNRPSIYVRPFARSPVRPSVRPFVRPSVHPFVKFTPRYRRAESNRSRRRRVSGGFVLGDRVWLIVVPIPSGIQSSNDGTQLRTSATVRGRSARMACGLIDFPGIIKSSSRLELLFSAAVPFPTSPSPPPPWPGSQPRVPCTTPNHDQTAIFPRTALIFVPLPVTSLCFCTNSNTTIQLSVVVIRGR